jgi:TRAP-type mannitol/chloroaromatic compound transport system substrate-binding protein
MPIRRRKLLLGATAVAAAAVPLPAPAIAQGIKELKLVTDWTEGLAGLDTGSQRFARSVTAMSDGRLKVTVYPSGKLVRPLETFDAVSSGIADMYHSFDPYFESKSPALYFFGAVPFGMIANELAAWVYFGGGQELWDEIDAPFGIKPLLLTQTGTQMGGWYNKEINGPEDYKGLRYRMPGLGAEVLRRMGATVVTVPAVDIIKAIKSGAIDGAEWIGPWPDISMGLDQVADYYYHPGFHEPSSNLTLGINKTLWDGLSGSERTLIETAARAEFVSSLAEFNAENVKWLKILRANERIKIRRFDDALLKVLAKVSAETLADQAAKDLQTRKVYDSYTGFMAEMIDWGELAETGYSNARRLALGSRRQL